MHISRSLKIAVPTTFLVIVYLIIADNNYYSTVAEKNQNETEFELKQESKSPNKKTGEFYRNLKSNKTKLILLWSPLYPSWDFLKLGKDTFKKSSCPVNRCEVTNDRNLLSNSDAVLFHAKTMSLWDIPRHRDPDQKWIFFSMEPPSYSYFPALRFTSGMFNWTMSYRLDSDVVVPYGSVVASKPMAKRAHPASKKDLLRTWKKKRSAVALISHCKTSGKRERYMKELSKFLDIDVFGWCGKAVCPESKTNKCLENFSRQYLFFLAFENSICRDYVTEKFFRSLRYDMIPVVFGGGNYTAVAPVSSFINAMEFSSPKSLASHLINISRNFTLFERYFKWKYDGYQINDYSDHCELCSKLHSDSFRSNTVYSDMTHWWLKESHCIEWKM